MNGNIRLYFKNEGFETVGIILQGTPGLNFTSLEWESIFHKYDSFSMQIGVSNPRDIDFILDKKTVYLIRNDTLQIAYIQRKAFDGKHLELEGIGLEGLLEKRFTIDKDYIPANDTLGRNYVGSVMCDIINDNAPFSWLVAERAANFNGPSIATFTELTGNVYKYLSTLSQAYDVGMKCVYDESLNKVRFLTYEVTSYQEEIAGRTYRLSDEMGNIKDLEYELDNSTYYNYARVIGTDDFTNVVDQSGDGERYEYSFKSKSKQGILTVAEYAQILYGEGVEELAKRRITESFILQPVGDQYIELGWEALSLSRNINVSTLSFCTELRETWEKVYQREYTFGYRVDAKDELIIKLQGKLHG